MNLIKNKNFKSHFESFYKKEVKTLIEKVKYKKIIIFPLEPDDNSSYFLNRINTRMDKCDFESCDFNDEIDLEVKLLELWGKGAGFDLSKLAKPISKLAAQLREDHLQEEEDVSELIYTMF